MSDPNRAFGMPSVPRNLMPSMFEILGWYSPHQPTSRPRTQPHTAQKGPAEEATESDKNPNDNSKECSSKAKAKKPCRNSMVKSGLYEFKEVALRRSASHQNCQVTDSKMVTERERISAHRDLDPQNMEDAREIQERKKRIKSFEQVTRDLPNSAFTTYFGKPAWEAYGRCNNNQKLLSHNVMPHRGTNHPKDIQSYYSALIKAKSKPLSTYLPRKPVQEVLPSQPKEVERSPINLPARVPDLVNHVRFAASVPRKHTEERIPSNKVPAAKNSKTKKTQKRQKKKKAVSLLKEDDGLKYMNARENLLGLLEGKRLGKSKLAWKVTECYPFDLSDGEKLRSSTVEWQRIHAAGVPSTKGETVGQLMA